MTKDDIKRIKQFVGRCQVADTAHIRSQWESIEFRVKQDDWDTETATLFIQEGDSPVVFLYPVLSRYTPEHQAFCVLREFAYYLLLQTPPEMETHWRQKLVLPSQDQIDSFMSRLNQGFKSYADVVQSFKTPVDRMVATHMSNAMMANGQAFAGASNVNVREWGPTQEFANCRRYFSAVPLTSAYCPREIDREFGSAFASMCVYDFKTVLHTQVKEVLTQIIERILNQAR